MDGKIIGYDISDTSCQISFYSENMDEPETYEASPESFQIPLVIGQKNDVWAIGIGAKRLSILHDGEIASELVSSALLRKKITLDGKTYDAVWLLAKFVKISLEHFESIEAIVFTVPELNEELANILRGVARHIGIENQNICVQDYNESFSNYMFNQPKELWQYEAALLYCDKDEIRASMLYKIKSALRDEPSNFISVEDVAFAKKEEMDAIFPLLHGERAREADERFKLFLQNVFEQRVISSVYLTGEGFDNNWYPESLKSICNGRRTFLGSNLFSKGACFSAMRRWYKISDGQLYINEHKLTHRISLKVISGGEPQILPVVQWGKIWYESTDQWEVLLEDTEDLELSVESIYKGKLKSIPISLEGLMERESFTTRLLIKTQFTDAKNCTITLTDLGFGEFYPSSGFEKETKIFLGGNYGKHHSVS